MDLVRKTPPALSCINATLVRANERVSSTTEDALIDLWIKAAEGLIEGRTNRSIMRQTFVLTVPIVQPVITLYRPAMDGGVTLVSAATTRRGIDATYDVSTLRAGLAGMLPTILFPTISDVAYGSTVIEYTVGQTDPLKVPAQIRQAVLLLASHWYRNREAVVTDQRRGTGSELPYGVESLVRDFRIPNVNITPNEL